MWVALSSAVMSNTEYQACMDHCVADFYKVQRWLLKRQGCDGHQLLIINGRLEVRPALGSAALAGILVVAQT